MSEPSRAIRAWPIGVIASSSRDLALDVVEREALEEEHGIVVADRRLQQPARVGGRGRGDDLQAGHVREPGVEALRVLGRELRAAAARRADDQRAARLAAEHVADLGRVVDDLVEGVEREVHGHDLHDRPRAGHRRADRGADEALLGDRRVAHAVGAELLHQAGGDAVGAVEEPDLLAHHEHALVALELLPQRLVERLADGLHDTGPSAVSPNGAPGAVRANCSAVSSSP